jgi:hypothetical protein
MEGINMAGIVESRVHLDWDEVYKKYGPELTRYEELIESFEKENKIEFTPGALEVIFVPLVEILQSGQKLDQGEVAETLRILIQDIAANPVVMEHSGAKNPATGQRSSWSVIRAYWKNWCNIPPICGPTANKE